MTGIKKTLKLSPELAAIMGEKTMTRQQVVKKMWAFVKEHNLQDPENKRYTICNDALFKVIGEKRFLTFGMTKFLKAHFLE